MKSSPRPPSRSQFSRPLSQARARPPRYQLPAWPPSVPPPRGLLEISGGPGDTPQAGGHLQELEDATHFPEPCPVSRWHTQAREHLALPGPSLAEDLKTVYGNPSRPPGLSASTLRVLRGENTETERLAALGSCSPQPGPCPPTHALPSPAGVGLRCRGAGGCKHTLPNATEGCLSRKGFWGHTA